MESSPAKVLWADLRYILGEIMYGGHIVNSLDRQLANTYLDFYMREDFRAPGTTSGCDRVLEHIEGLKSETPLAFGLYPNAEIGFRTANSEELLKTILELFATTGGDGGYKQSSPLVAEAALQDILDQYPDTKFKLGQIVGSVDEVGPFPNIVLQECERINLVLHEVTRPLIELDLGFRGELTISERWMLLILFCTSIPQNWELLSYPSWTRFMVI